MLNSEHHGDFQKHEILLSNIFGKIGGSDLKTIRSSTAKAIGSDPVIYVDPSQSFDFPFAISRSDWQNWAHLSEQLVSLIYEFVNSEIKRLGQLYLTNIGIPIDYIKKLERVPGLACLDHLIARPDFFLGPAGPIFLEANIDSSLGGLGTADCLSHVYRSVLNPYLERERKQLLPIKAVPTLAAQLCGWANTSEHKVRAVITDWEDEISEVPWPYDRLRDELLKYGVESLNAGPSELAFVNGRLHAGSVLVDTVYRGVTPTKRMWSNWEDWEALWAAANSGLPILSSVWSFVYSSKAVLGTLWEAGTEGRLSHEANTFVRLHVPWTWRLNRSYCSPKGSPDLVPTIEYARRMQHNLVLKSPSDGSCVNVTVGRYVSAYEWSDAIASALAAGGYVIQQYVNPCRAMNSRSGGSEGLKLFQCNLAVFVMGRRAAGTCIRGSTATGPYISCMHGASEGVAMILDDL